MGETVLADCGHEARPADLRRGMCVSCYRKLREAGCPLPPKRCRWDDYDPLARWAATLSPETRARILAALQAVSDQSEPPPVPLREDHRVTTA